jgi:hypothetical protein
LLQEHIFFAMPHDSLHILRVVPTMRSGFISFPQCYGCKEAQEGRDEAQDGEEGERTQEEAKIVAR